MQPSHDINAMQQEARLVWQDLLGMIDQIFLHEIQQRGLEAIVSLANSKIGFLYTINTGTIGIRNIAATDHPGLPLLHGPGKNLNQNGIWSACLASGKPVISNHATRLDDPRAHNLGPITRSLTVPVHNGHKIVAVLGVGNNPLPYTTADAKWLVGMASDLWRVVLRKRLFDTIATEAEQPPTQPRWEIPPPPKPTNRPAD